MDFKPAIFRQATLAFSVAAALAGCGGSSNTDSALLRQNINASEGGTFSVSDQGISVVVPAGALSANAELTVRKIAESALPTAGTFASSDFNSDAFTVELLDPSGAAVKLNQPIKLVLRSRSLPTHPTLGEVANLSNGQWQRVGASFFRANNQSAVALTNEASGTYRVAFRTLQRTSGDSVARGQAVFTDDTFGNEAFFGGVLGLHTLLNGVTPAAAVGLGVQVDITKVPPSIVAVMTGADLAAKDAALVNPAVTKALLQADAVIGVRARFDGGGNMTSAGITCALCHVNVTPTEFQLSSGTALLPIGQPRFDGAPNAKMDSGTILALTPFVQGLNDNGATAAVLKSWGPGRFDIRALPDNVLEDNVVNPTKNPPIWNFVDLEKQGYLFGWDGLFKNNGTSNNALASQAEAVYDLVMHGNGAFGTAAGSLPPELSVTPPQSLLSALAKAETDQPGNDIPVSKLLDVQAWMRSIVSPAPLAFDEAKAEQGFELFNGKGACSSCHKTADFTGPGTVTAVTHPGGGLAGGIKIPSLRGVAHNAPYLSNGSVATLAGAVEGVLQALKAVNPGAPTLTDAEKAALVEYLKSL
ncbi:MAG: cytochrome c [Polaromonas sp.]